MQSPSTENTPDPLQASSHERDQQQGQGQGQESGHDLQLEQHTLGNGISKSVDDSVSPGANNTLSDSTATSEIDPLLEQKSSSPVLQSDVTATLAEGKQSDRDSQAETTPYQLSDGRHEYTSFSEEGPQSAEPGVSSDQTGRDDMATTQPGEELITTKPRLKRPALRPVSLDITPKKSILKAETAYPLIEQPVRNPIFKSQWLQSTVNKLVVMTGPATPTAYTGNSPSMFRKLVNQAAAATMATPPPSEAQRPTRPPVFSNSERPYLQLESENSSASLLSDKALKRVRFSVGQLTTEHIFHNDDAYESAEESEPQKTQVQIITTPAQPKKPMMTTEGIVVDDNIYTAKEIMNHYLTACNTREEPPIERLLQDMRVASTRTSNPLLSTIDLTGVPLPRRSLDPITDLLTLEFGLRQLYLDNCNLEDETLKGLLYSLLVADTLTVLSLQDNKKIKSAGFKYISVLVKKTKTLKVLNISGSNLDKRSIEFLSHALRVGRLGFGSRLEELRVDRCGLRGNLLEILGGGVWIGVLMRDYDEQPNAAVPVNNEEQGFKRVFPGISNPELLKRTHGVESLDISDNDLRQGADYVAQTLRRNLSLRTLVMANNNLDPIRLAALADALVKNKLACTVRSLKLNIGLESLDLSNNRICGPDITGIKSMTQKLVYNKTLKKLTLSNTGMQSEGAIALAEFLPETRTLVHLDLTGNDLVDIAGVMALSVSIRMNKSLTCLDMNVPPNDPEFARLSRDILRACVSNMEEQTGSNAGMPSPDDIPTTTIFRQPTHLPREHTPESTAVSAEDRRWALLESVANELYWTRSTVTALERALNHEKALRRSWMEQNDIYQNDPVAASGQTEVNGQSQDSANKNQSVPAADDPMEQRMRDIAKGVLHRGPPQYEHLYNQGKLHQASIMDLMTKVDNDKALQELETMYNLLNAFTHAYRTLFALPELPPDVTIGQRTNSLPINSAGQTSAASESPGDPNEKVNAINSQDVPTPTLTKEPTSDLESSFLLEDEEDMDDDIYTSDTLNGAPEASPADGVSSPPLSAIENGNVAVETLHDKGLKPAPLIMSDIGSVDSQRSPSSIASPLEKLRKAVEEEEGEVLRRGKELVENELENGSAAEAMTGEELKIQILSADTDA
ncbi:hypothetical protein BGX34_004629 [Mortierella sp. NVP85]|nr:hypothetical protein BGX34_004629 [Mortierella sp. NVP85]